MMLCALFSLCHAQKIKFEYDESGNLVKKSPVINYESSTFGKNYQLKVGPSPTKGPLTIKVVDGNHQGLYVLNYRMQVIIHPVTGTGTAYSSTFDTCEGSVDLSNPYQCQFASYSGVLAVTVLVFDNPMGAPAQGSIKIVKK